MSYERDEFIRATFELSRVNPAAWTRFLDAHAAWVGALLEESFGAPEGNIVVAHGMGRQALRMRELFRDIDNLYLKLNKK